MDLQYKYYIQVSKVCDYSYLLRTWHVIETFSPHYSTLACIIIFSVNTIGISSHWVCTATGNDTNEVLLFDSLWSTTILERMVELQIAQIYHHRCAGSKTLTIRKVNVQQQLFGTSDRGLFAVAYATEVCHGRDPAKANFNQSLMKDYLLDCLEAGSIQRFPQMSKVPNRKQSAKPPRSITIQVDLYCYCGMPEWYDNMILCDKCEQWFHKSCVNLKGVRGLRNMEWLCDGCRGKGIPQETNKPEEFLPKYPAKKHKKNA